MTLTHRALGLTIAFACLFGLAACGSESATPAAGAETAQSVVEQGATTDETPDGDDTEHSNEEGHEGEESHDGESDEHGNDEDHDDEEGHDSDEYADDKDHEGEEHGDGDDHDDHDDHDDASGGLGAHEHGTAELSVAWIGADVAIDLISPTYNIFGFEYEPVADEDLAVATAKTDTLSTGVITINAEAGCSLSEPVATELEFEGSHSEMTASWLFVCENPDAIDELDATKLFAEFPNFEDIDAQVVSASDQSAAELSPSAPILRLG